MGELVKTASAIDAASLEAMGNEELLDFLFHFYVDNCIVPPLPNEIHFLQMLKHCFLFRFNRGDPFQVDLRKMSDDELIDYVEKTLVFDWRFLGDPVNCEVAKHELQRRLKLSA